MESEPDRKFTILANMQPVDSDRNTSHKTFWDPELQNLMFRDSVVANFDVTKLMLKHEELYVRPQGNACPTDLYTPIGHVQ